MWRSGTFELNRGKQCVFLVLKDQSPSYDKVLYNYYYIHYSSHCFCTFHLPRTVAKEWTGNFLFILYFHLCYCQSTQYNCIISFNGKQTYFLVLNDNFLLIVYIGNLPWLHENFVIIIQKKRYTHTRVNMSLKLISSWSQLYIPSHRLAVIFYFIWGKI